jgi:hypothetical protein
MVTFLNKNPIASSHFVFISSSWGILETVFEIKLGFFTTAVRHF